MREARAICGETPVRKGPRDPSLAGLLERVVLAALEMEPALHCASATALATDVRPFLAAERILPCPHGGACQLRKLVALRELPFALASVVLVTAIASEVALAGERLAESRAQSSWEQTTLDGLLEMIGKARNESTGPEACVVDLVEVPAPELEPSFVGAGGVPEAAEAAGARLPAGADPVLARGIGAFVERAEALAPPRRARVRAEGAR